MIHKSAPALHSSSNAGRYDIFDSFESHIIGSFDWLVLQYELN